MFRKEVKRTKIEENRRLKKAQDNTQQLTKRDVGFYLVHLSPRLAHLFLVKNQGEFIAST